MKAKVVRALVTTRSFVQGLIISGEVVRKVSQVSVCSCITGFVGTSVQTVHSVGSNIKSHFFTLRFWFVFRVKLGCDDPSIIIGGFHSSTPTMGEKLILNVHMGTPPPHPSLGHALTALKLRNTLTHVNISELTFFFSFISLPLPLAHKALQIRMLDDYC